MTANKELTDKVKEWQKIQSDIRAMQKSLDDKKEYLSSLETEIGDYLNPGNMEMNESIGIWVKTDVNKQECLVLVKKTTGYSLHLRRTRFDSVEAKNKIHQE